MMSASEVYSPSYSQEEIEQILHFAIARKSLQGDFDRQQLVEIAKELDIDEYCLQAAEADWLAQRSQDQKRQAFDRYRKDKLQQKVARYAIINTFIVSLDLVGAGTLSWSLYILLIWGLGLSLTVWKTYQPRGEAYEQEFERWKLRSEMKRSLETLWDRLQKAWQE